MYAGPLVRGVAAVEEHAEALYSLRVLRGNPEASRRTETVFETLSDVAALLRAGAPFPPAGDGRVGEGRADGDPGPAVPRALAAIYDDGRAPVGAVGEAAVEAAAAAGRVEVIEGTVVVPLAAAGPPARNWDAVVAFLRDRVEDARAAARRVAGRLRSVTPAGRRTAWDSVVAMLASLEEVFERAHSEKRFVRATVDGPADREAEFAQWTLRRLDGDNHA